MNLIVYGICLRIQIPVQAKQDIWANQLIMSIFLIRNIFYSVNHAKQFY